jgi:hypothetical protein
LRNPQSAGLAATPAAPDRDRQYLVQGRGQRSAQGFPISTKGESVGGRPVGPLLENISCKVPYTDVGARKAILLGIFAAAIGK